VLIATFAALAMLAQPGDTTLQVQRGDRLEAENHNGDITVRTWTRNAVMLRVNGSQRGVTLDRSGGIISAELDWEHGDPGSVSYELTVPAWMPVELSGVNSDMVVTGVRADVSVETVSGSIVLEGGRGSISLTSVEGSVTVTGAEGRIQLESVNDFVLVRGSSGDIEAESVNGAVTIDADSRRVSAETVNGDITFSGPIHDDGRYTFTTHNGNVVIGVQEGANAAVSVSTFQGDLQAAFPVTVRGSRERGFAFTIGNGSAHIEVESFQGTIRLVRPAAVRIR
jgi:DUF4097 and DUF4098 domain-containing protein YvlB